MKLRLEGTNLPGRVCPRGDNFPGYENIHVGVQRKGGQDDLVGLTPGDAPSATWTLEVTAVPTGTGTDWKGECVHGRPGQRFVYLSWGTVDGDGTYTMFRRAKLWLDGVPAETAAAAVETGTLVGRLGLTDARGQPLCAGVRPPLIDWAAG